MRDPGDHRTPDTDYLGLALQLARRGWHVFPLSPINKRPLANCAACRDHSIAQCQCLCLRAGRWCHGVRAATTDPARLTEWWRRESTAAPGVAAGLSGLVLVDIDAHGAQLPANLATGLLPGIILTAENLPPELWNDETRLRDGRDTMRLLAAIRGSSVPWPGDPAYQPVTVATPSGGRHLWYRAPAPGLRQALSDAAGRHGLGWQIDIKAGWSHGLAPGAVTQAGSYRVLAGDVGSPGTMPDWLASEVMRVCSPSPSVLPRSPGPASVAPIGRRGAAYLTAVIDRRAAELAGMRDGRKRALAALAYQVGGLLGWSGLSQGQITDRLIEVGTAAGLGGAESQRIVSRSIANGLARPLCPPRS